MQVFKLYGIKCLPLNGTMTTAERTSAIERFKNDPETRVFFISTVGSVGLNLTEADVVICFVSEIVLPQGE
jgi:SNF2 family DNA or RNA helicase